MQRIDRKVERGDWVLAEELGSRRARLLDVPSSNELLSRVAAECVIAAERGDLTLWWQPSDERPGHHRLAAHAPLDETTFDQFFNGRSGYRAQYYLSPEEGVLYNRAVVSSLVPALRLAYEKVPLEVSWSLFEWSISTPHAKVWVFRETEAFNQAAAETLNPIRWVENDARMGRRAPLPSHLRLDIKGAFIDPAASTLFIDECKLERPLDLFKRGFS